MRVGIDDPLRLELHQAEQIQRAPPRRALLHPAVGFDRIPDLVPDSQDRVERILGALEYHRALGPAELAQLFWSQVHHINTRRAALIEDLPLADAGLFG